MKYKQAGTLLILMHPEYPNDFCNAWAIAVGLLEKIAFLNVFWGNKHRQSHQPVSVSELLI